MTSVASAAGQGGAPPEDRRPIVTVEPGQLHELVDRAEEVLLGDDAGRIYQRSGLLVRPIRTEMREYVDQIRWRRGAPQLILVEEAYITDRLARTARFVRRNRKDELVPIDCPEKVARTLMGRAGMWMAMPLISVMEVPVVLPNGKVLQSQGYDPSSGLLLDFGDAKFPPLPDRVSFDEAAAALRTLEVLLENFPFVDPIDHSVALAAILTPFARPCFAAAPGFAFTAPQMGTGKSLLAHMVSLLATGRGAAAMTQSDDERSDQKRIFALLLAGTRIALIDNVDRPLCGAALASVLTEADYEDRLLGRSQNRRAPTTSTTWLFTGNNLVIKGDLRTRILPCRIDAVTARPYERRFKVDLRRAIRDRRSVFVAAVLTILKGYLDAGRPFPAENREFGRFEGWSALVRGALMWLGQADPVSALDRLEDADPDTQDLARVHALWAEAVGAQRITASEFLKRGPRSTGGQDVLRELFGNARGVPCSVRLGIFLAKNERRVHDGRRFEQAGCHSGTSYWRLVTVGGGGGGRGGCSHPPAKAEGDGIGEVVSETPTTPTTPTHSEGGTS